MTTSEGTRRLKNSIDLADIIILGQGDYEALYARKVVPRFEVTVIQAPAADGYLPVSRGLAASP
jgi:hypothetical protein